MRFERFVLEADDSTRAMEFHPRLTFVTGLHEPNRLRLANLLTQSLGAAPPGVHVELADDEGHHLAIFRPHNAPALVIDVDSSANLTKQFTRPNGTVDLLGLLGLDHATALDVMRVDRDDFRAGYDTGTDDHDAAHRLAGLDQDELSAAASDYQAAKRRLQAIAGVDPLTSTDLARFEQIDAAHRRVIRTHDADASLRRRGFWIAGIAAAAGAVVFFFDAWTAQFLLISAILAALVPLINGRKVRAARQAERAVLHETGFKSFEEYQARAGRFVDRQPREELRRRAQDFSTARVRWEQLDGKVSVDWYLTNRRAISGLATSHAELVYQGLLAPDAAMVSTNGARTVAFDGARSVVKNLVSARQLGLIDESLPLILDEAFDGTEAEVADLLAVVSKLSRNHQFVVLTNRPDVIAWAGLRPTEEVMIIDWAQSEMATTP